MHDLLERLNLPATDAPKHAPPAKKAIHNPSPCSFCDQPMGEDGYSQLSITLAHGGDSPLTRAGWAHHRCLNAALHPTHMIRVYKHDKPIDPDELDRLIDTPPTAAE